MSKTSADFWMEDVTTISLKAMKVIEEALKEYGITLEAGVDDEIYLPMFTVLERLSNGNYRHEH